MKESNQVFVKIDEYKDVLDILNVIKTKLNEANETLAKLSEIKSKEDEELESWRLQLEEIERKISFIDTALFEPSS